MLRYLVPQLTTALSSAKMTGEVDPKLQALAAGQSFLQGPQQQTAAVAPQQPQLCLSMQRTSFCPLYIRFWTIGPKDRSNIFFFTVCHG